VKKVATDFLQSFYYFAQAIGFFLSAFLLIGWWKRRRELLTNWREMLLALLIGFYFLGFALTYTGERFMVHLIPYSFGWVAFAALAADQWLRDALVSVRMRPVLVLIAIVLLPQTLWPLGYDLRGFRYAGIDIARRDSASKAVVASDGRAAFYASTPHILLPVMNAASLCRWLTTEPDAGFVLVTRREESTMGNLRDLSCLQFVNRYPRSRSGYYDLFEIRRLSPSRPRE
jgi:hypothetical protein